MASGFVVIELGVLGLSLLAASVTLIACKGPRLLAFGGLLTGFGALWTFLFGRIQLTCGADAFFPDPSCSTADLTQWIVGSTVILLAGVLLSAFALWRARSPR